MKKYVLVILVVLVALLTACAVKANTNPSEPQAEVSTTHEETRESETDTAKKESVKETTQTTSKRQKKSASKKATTEKKQTTKSQTTTKEATTTHKQQPTTQKPTEKKTTTTQKQTTIEDYKDKKILILDDFAMSEDFLFSLKEILIDDLGVLKNNIRTMCLTTTLTAKGNSKAPDYYWRIFDTTKVYLPWGKPE